MAKIVFWVSLGVVLYVYLGYPCILFLIGIFKKSYADKKISSNNDFLPNVSLLIVAYNEEKNIENKLKNSLALDYPKNKLEIIIISDASTDNTEKIVKSYEGKGIKLFAIKERGGKTSALNSVFPEIKTDIIIFSDANSVYDRNAIKKLTSRFEDKNVGCVCGNLKLTNVDETGVSKGEGLYWKYENVIKKLESQQGSLLMGAGTIYAIRRELYQSVDIDLADDFTMPLSILAKGYKVIYEEDAIAYEKTYTILKEEFNRKRRIAARDSLAYTRIFYKLPVFVLWQLTSHKFLRWLISYFLFLIFIANIFLLSSVFYSVIFVLQIVFYFLAFLKLRIPYYFCAVNMAASLGVWDMFIGKRYITWEKAKSSR